MTAETEGARMAKAAKATIAAGISNGQCLCGKVRFEIDVPARWAWHDHSRGEPPRAWRGLCHLCRKLAQAFSGHQGPSRLARYEDKATKTVRSFCARCGTPIAYERARSPHMVNISARAVRGPHRPTAALSHRDRGIAGVDLYRRAAGAAEGLSRRGLAASKKKRAELEGMFELGRSSRCALVCAGQP